MAWRRNSLIIFFLSFDAWSNHLDVSPRHHITSQNTCKCICGGWSCQKELCVNCHETGERPLFCVIKLTLAEARVSLGVKSVNNNACHWLCLCSNKQMVVLSKVKLLLERISKCLISVMAILRLTHCLVWSLRSACHFWRPHILAGRSYSESSGCVHYVRIVSAFLGQVSSWSAAPVTDP